MYISLDKRHSTITLYFSCLHLLLHWYKVNANGKTNLEHSFIIELF
jgi:hypothetical protein